MRAKASSQVKLGYLFNLPVFSRHEGSHLVCDPIACPYIGALCFPRAESGTPITVLLGYVCIPICCSGTCPLPALPEQRNTGDLWLQPPFTILSPQMGHRPLMSSPPPLPSGFLLRPQTGNLFPYLDDEASRICVVICPG